MTNIAMRLDRLITRETMENTCKGKDFEENSVNDDLDTFFEDIRLGKMSNNYVRTYFLPKLTKEELDLVERKDEDFMHTFQEEMYADVDKAEMLLSESDSKFVLGGGQRKTFTIKNSFPKKRTKKSIENQPRKKIRTDPGLDDKLTEQKNLTG